MGDSLENDTVKKIQISIESSRSIYLELLCNDLTIGHATGFVTFHSQRAYLITNRHNVTGRDQYTNALLNKDGVCPDAIKYRASILGRLGEWEDRKVSLYDDEVKPSWFEHPTLKEKADVIALPLDDTNGLQFYDYDMVNLGAPVILRPSEIVSVVGFPFGRSVDGFAIWASGFVASEPELDFDALPTFLIDCRTRKGQSGSPVIAYRNGSVAHSGGINFYSGPVSRFLGIYSGRLNAESDIGIVWKPSTILEILHHAR